MVTEIESQKSSLSDIKDMNVNKEIVLTPEEEILRKSYLKKIDLRILPVIVLLYFANSLDRSNIGTASINGLYSYLKFSTSQQGNVISLFTIFYLAFEAPANMLLKKTKPRVWFSFIVTAWSLSTFYLAFATSANLFILGRCLIGIFEAGFTPGIAAYLPYWYTRKELGSRMAVFFIALPLSGIVGGPIAGAIFFNFERYQGIFFIEGLATIFIGILTYFIMHDYPDTSKFFTPKEKELAVRRITGDQGLASKAKISRKQTLNAFKDWKIYVFSFICFGPNNSLILLSYFGPTIIAGMGYTNTAATFMSGIPHACGAVTMIFAILFLNRIQLSKLYLICIPVEILGACLCAFVSKPAVRLLGLCLVAAGTNPLIPASMTWMSTNAGSVPKRMVSTAIYTTIAGLAGFVSPYMFTRKYAPDYYLGHTFNLVMLALSLQAHRRQVTNFKYIYMQIFEYLCIKTTLAIAKFLNTIEFPRHLLISSIKLGQFPKPMSVGYGDSSEPENN
ncbi:hypothetical protein BB561_003942 [Smittium simulii]|uniref:Major facilitator superfamily (MFS) profile domain-containing protein n=1 Tax=Smittium simulii TaxID=133385 RepID=A0A2T9YIW9_9FUNG|nr:hypothetical protein BB561_003942 [Smittium simulii]